MPISPYEFSNIRKRFIDEIISQIDNQLLNKTETITINDKHFSMSIPTPLVLNDSELEIIKNIYLSVGWNKICCKFETYDNKYYTNMLFIDFYFKPF